MTNQPTINVSQPLAQDTSEEGHLTGAQMAEMSDLGWGELVKGHFISMPPPGYQHGLIAFRLGKFLSNFVDAENLGYVLGGEAGVYTGRNPDTVRGMDVAFISYQRMAQVGSQVYLDVAPELIVEILSPNDLWSTVNQKLAEYFAIETQMVWVVDPKRQTVHVYHSVTDLSVVSMGESLSGFQTLPGFSLLLDDLFVAL